MWFLCILRQLHGHTSAEVGARSSHLPALPLPSRRVCSGGLCSLSRRPGSDVSPHTGYAIIASGPWLARPGLSISLARPALASSLGLRAHLALVCSIAARRACSAWVVADGTLPARGWGVGRRAPPSPLSPPPRPSSAHTFEQPTFQLPRLRAAESTGQAAGGLRLRPWILQPAQDVREPLGQARGGGVCRRARAHRHRQRLRVEEEGALPKVEMDGGVRVEAHQRMEGGLHGAWHVERHVRHRV